MQDIRCVGQILMYMGRTIECISKATDTELEQLMQFSLTVLTSQSSSNSLDF